VLVSVIHANNEIGTIQPIREISKICREREILLHTDAAQSVGKIDARVDQLGVDLLTVAGHKLYAPKGVGALYVRRGVALEPVLYGADHEQGLRPGTENVAYIVALGAAAARCRDHLSAATTRMEQLRDRIWDRLREAIGPGLTINGDGAQRLPNTLSVSFPGVAGVDLLRHTAEICASTGAACHGDSTEISSTLRAIGADAEQARGTVRLSVGWPTTIDEIDRAADLLISSWESLREHPSRR
jgi:cysteine desulfurase